MFNSRLINTKVAGGGGGCTDIVDNYDPFGDSSGLALYQLNGDVTDESGNYSFSTASNVSYPSGVFNESLKLNSSTSYVSGSGLTNGFPLTFSFWVKPSGNSNPVGLLINKRTSATSGFSIRGSYNTTLNQNIMAFLNGGGYLGGSDAIAYGLLPTNVWTHIVVIVESGGWTSYVNGAYDNAASGGVSLSNTNITLGKFASIGNWVGADWGLDQIRVFNRGLDPLEIEALYTEELCICDGTVDTLDILGDGSCIATYPLDGNANDLSGNYPGTPTDVSYGVGEFDLAGVFNGSSSKIELPTNVFSFSSFTLSGWVNVNANTDENTLFEIVDSNNYPNHTTIVISGGDVNNRSARFLFRNYLANEFSYRPTGDSSALGWRHYAMTYDGSTVNCYINGSIVQTGSLSLTNPIGSITGVRLGLSAGSRVLNGSIDQVRVFNKALNSTEVTTLYNETACTKVTRTAGATQILGDSSCVAYYKLDGNGIDSANNNNASLSNLSYGNGEFDFAGVFNGSSSRAYLNNVRYSFPFSISLWFKSVASKTQDIYTDLGGGRAIYLRMYSDGLIKQLAINSANGAVVIGNSTPYNDNQWHNIIGVFNSNSLSLYIDGQNVANSTTFNYGSRSYGANPNIGVSYSGGFSGWVDGSIDQVRIFNKAVSASEVTTLYNEGV